MSRFPIKYIAVAAVLILIFLIVLSFGAERKSPLQTWLGSIFYKINETEAFDMTDEAVINPFMGYAVSADNKSAVGRHSLVYIDITFKELQPDSADEFDFETIEKENHIHMWKEQGKHAVLRFVCDYPSDESHSDIPEWLMEITGDGTFYDTSYGKGYSPDYNNEAFINYHEKAIKSLAEYFDDGFVSYVQLGSLGHWGEWHVKSGEGIVPIPKEDIREKYVSHYTSAFKNAKLMMRRPFNEVKEHGMGIYNDMIGASDDTDEWLDWIACGGEYSQTGEKNALSAVPDFWRTAPSGGEFTSSVPMEKICTDGLEETIKLLQKSHTTFIGPKTPTGSSERGNALYEKATERIISSIGYRIGISEVSVRQARLSENIKLTLEWKNEGIAPVYFDLPVNLYACSANGDFTEIAQVNVKLSEILPGETVYSKTVISSDIISDSEALYIGISDPMTNKPSLKLVSKQEGEGEYFKIYGI